jgi:alpha-beta hydrolase superfamily lysophospholipase
MQAFLVHGMGRSPRSLTLLALRLERAGIRTSRFGYSVLAHDLDAIVRRFVAHVRERATGPYGIVGHSLGNVIARMALHDLPDGLSRLAMLAPPNRVPRLARMFRDVPGYRALTRDAGRKLADPAFFDALPVPTVPTLVLAGTAGPRARWLPFGGAPSDGVVALDETHLAGADHREVDAIHTLIMNDAKVAIAVARFLRDGS